MLLVGTAPQAQPVKPARELRLASSAPLGSLWASQSERWARGLDQASHGELKLQLFLGGQLGADAAVIQQVASGRVDMASVSLAGASVVAPELLTVVLPMQYRSAAEFACTLDAGIGGLVGERLARKGLQLIGLTEVGSIQLAARRALRAPADLAGMKAATTGSRLGQMAWTALGARPMQISQADIPVGFQTGLVDVAPSPPVLYVASGLNKLAPVMTVVDFYQMAGVMVMNQAVWNSLSPAHQAALTGSRVPLDLTRQEVRDGEARALADHVRGGGQVVVLSETQREAMRTLLVSRHAAMVAEAGPDAALLHARVESARKSCDKARAEGGPGSGRAR